MNIYGRKISSKYLLALIFTALFFSVTFNSPANYSAYPGFDKLLAIGLDTVPRLPRAVNDTVPKDSLALLKDSLARALDSAARDSLFIIGDTTRDSTHRQIDTIDMKVSKDTLDAAIDYKASDS